MSFLAIWEKVWEWLLCSGMLLHELSEVIARAAKGWQMVALHNIIGVLFLTLVIIVCLNNISFARNVFVTLVVRTVQLSKTLILGLLTLFTHLLTLLLTLFTHLLTLLLTLFSRCLGVFLAHIQFIVFSPVYVCMYLLRFFLESKIVIVIVYILVIVSFIQSM